jgi:HAD superfamily phosphoserine phosphatase-like hydrolase
MKLALFLDVDRTLTREYIQHIYAKELGCESEYQALEKQFQAKKLSSKDFGDAIIKLFAAQKFTAERAKELFEKVELQPWTDELLKFDVDKFLVSSGPSYYIDQLAYKYEIPKGRVYRSEYEFDPQTKLIKKCKAVNEQQKAQFVRSHRQKYDFTIGIGDNLEFDGPFVSQCTIPLMTIATDRYISVPNFSLAILLLENIVKLTQETRVVEVDKMTIKQTFNAFSLQSWGVFIAVISAVFALGTALGAKLW